MSALVFIYFIRTGVGAAMSAAFLESREGEFGAMA